MIGEPHAGEESKEEHKDEDCFFCLRNELLLRIELLLSSVFHIENFLN